MNTIKGPGLFLAQFIGDEAPFNSLEGICQWAAAAGYKGVQMPTTDARIFDLEKAANDLSYCEEVQAVLANHDLVITELSTHLQGQLVAVHPAYDKLFDGFAPEQVRNNPSARQAWAKQQLMLAAQASKNLALTEMASFSGALLWPYLYPWPQRPEGLVEMGFAELAALWLPILDECDRCGVDVCFELHPGEDLHDGVSFDRFLAATGDHPRANILYDPSHFLLQQLDYLGFIDRYHPRIKMMHVKDAEFNPTASQGMYGGYSAWVDRAARFRSLGDGQIDFGGIFSKLSQYGFKGWAVVEWECCIKHPQQGAEEGAQFVKDHIIQVTDKAFDDFANSQVDDSSNRFLLGLQGTGERV